MTKEQHKHEYTIRTKKVLLARYRVEDGSMKYFGTTGSDILKQHICKCGKKITYDLERKKI